jgi:signal transduction histidine kinase
MKLKNQLSILVTGIVVLPLLTAAIFSLYMYFRSPRRFFPRGYYEIKRLNELNLAEEEKKALQDFLETVPHEIEISVIFRGKVIFSTIPQISAGAPLHENDIIQLMNETNLQYDYQFQTLNFSAENSAGSRATVISRFDPRGRGEKKRPFFRFFYPSVVITAILEIFAVTAAILIMKSVSSSVEILQKTTQKIADGELETKIETNASSANEIGLLTEDLERMRRSLKENQEKQSRFIMGISHDLRTPVAVIKGYAEAISDGIVHDADEIKKSVSIIIGKAEHLESMIDDLINYVKMNDADWKRTMQTVKLKPFLEEFAKNMKMTAEIYNRSVFSAINLDEQTAVMDRKLFSRALENLFSNALRYTKERDEIFLEAEKNQQGKIEISMRDTGTGISEEDLQKVFDLFYRGTNSRRENGMGIGLSVVKTIVDSHGWKIGVKSRLNEGTTFTITLG